MKISWRLCTIVREICISRTLESKRLSHIFREANFVATALANLGHQKASELIWISSFPQEANRAFNFEANLL